MFDYKPDVEKLNKVLNGDKVEYDKFLYLRDKRVHLNALADELISDFSLERFNNFLIAVFDTCNAKNPDEVLMAFSVVKKIFKDVKSSTNTKKLANTPQWPKFAKTVEHHNVVERYDQYLVVHEIIHGSNN